jgi:DNA-binding NarL/FixJ family response regulator
MNRSAGLIRTICIDDHPLIVAGVRAILEAESDFLFVGGASTGEEGIRLFREVIPDVTLVDLRLGVITGVEVIATIAREYPGAKLIALTSYKGDEDIHRALAAGAMGYILKDLMHSDLMDAIRKVDEGRPVLGPSVAKALAEHTSRTELTRRELEVLTLMASGCANKSIASRAGVSEETVKFHVKNILSKLEANDRTHAIGIAVRRGMLHLD